MVVISLAVLNFKIVCFFFFALADFVLATLLQQPAVVAEILVCVIIVPGVLALIT